MMRHIHPRKQTDYIGKNLIKAKTITTATSEECRTVCRPGSVKIFKEQKPDFYDNGQGLAKNKQQHTIARITLLQKTTDKE